VSIGAQTTIPREKLSSDLKVKDDRGAKVLWWLLMSLRFVIPGYMLYVAYLYWTVPIPEYLQHPY
jgi:hypothetical protein